MVFIKSHFYTAIDLANEREQAAEEEVHDAIATVDDLEKQLTTISLEYTQCKQALQQSQQETEKQIGLTSELNLDMSTLTVHLNTQEQTNEKLTQSAEHATLEVERLQVTVSELKEEKNELRSENKRLAVELSTLSDERNKQLGELIAKLDTTTNDAA